MTKYNRWPNHADWARADAIATLKDVIDLCGRLSQMALPDKALLKVQEIKFKALKSITDLERVKAEEPNPRQDALDISQLVELLTEAVRENL